MKNQKTKTENGRACGQSTAPCYLLPCPFCGETPTLHKGYSGYSILHVCYAVQSTIGRGKKKDVVKLWNKRFFIETLKEKAPWKDFNGNEIYVGDIVEHPAGEKGEVFLTEADNEADRWRVDYCSPTSPPGRLCLQIGEKGRAVVIVR